MPSTTEVSTFTFITRSGFKHPNTRGHVRLLGPCFKTGRLKPLCQHPKHGCYNTPRRMPHSLNPSPTVKIDADPSTRKCTQQDCKADPRPTRLTSSVSLSAISRTV
ncbi:hypothetical protein SERLA73DRAFT_80692 [Serpula lacrymans var. lacrymans S7.3]|uniref:Uncharacterized protein n=1 Tax=Serpula lacrymans var. lacrymans (strain S7.3) TaxID=936435 RepID=F8QK49_SERL3|nr:hypothetical protein SERLA73DRAFT_80692 [Serpula lacrymans var. lacrymans S7.3]